MDKEENQALEPNIRLQMCVTAAGNEEEATDVPTRSPVIGSGSMEDDSIGRNLPEELVSTIFPLTDGQAAADTDAAFAESFSSGETLLAVKLADPVIEIDNLDDSYVPPVDVSSNLGLMVSASAHQETTANQCCAKDLEDEQQRLNISPSFEGDNLSLHDRDPNYATQRPDTLGAINLVAQNLGVVTSTIGKVFQNGSSKSRALRHGSGQGDASEDMMFNMAQLGRRTRGAGMDQLELNQHHLVVGSDDGSDSGDAAERESTQCESTEADQYKMNPEADQSESIRPDYAQEPNDIAVRTVRNGARASGLVTGANNSGRRGNRYQVEDDVDEDELADASEIAEDEDQDWERLNDLDLADRTEDDRQYNVAEANSGQMGASGGGRTSHPGVWMMANESSAAVTGVSSLYNVLLRQHPNSAFSQLKPGDGGLYGEASHSGVNSNALANADKKFMQSGKDKTMSSVVSLQDQGVAKPIALFKPILHEGRSNYAVEQSLNKGSFPRQHSEGNASDASGFRFGSIAKHGKTLSDNGLRSQTDKEDLTLHSPRLLTSNPNFEAGSSESLHSCLPRRADHMMIGEPNGGLLSRPLMASDYQQQQHLVPLGCDHPSQITPPQKQTRSSYHVMNDSLDLSPIRPPSSHALHQQHYHQQTLNFIHSPGLVSVGDAFQTAATADSSSRAHSYGYKTSSELGSEISDIQEVRTRLHGLLTLSDRTIPDKARYDETNDVDELLTGHRGQLLIDQSSSWSLTGLHEALPLSSKYLLSGTNQAKLDVAVLAAENRALRDAGEQQRFKRKHCEKQIQQLQNKILELQENLTVAVSIDRRKDLTIEQLDKALVKVAENWHQKESEFHETINFLRQENASLKQALDSQRQVSSRLDLQRNHTVQQLQLEQQRSSQICQSKDQHISELTSQCQRLQLMLDDERERWQLKLDDERQEMEKLKEKMQLQFEELRSAHHDDLENWAEREKQNLLKIEMIEETHSKIIEAEKTKMEQQKQAYHELEMVLMVTQAEVEHLQLESETIMREKESLKVEIGLMEARHLSDLHQLESELQSSADKKVEELSHMQSEAERNLHDLHRLQLQEYSQRHLEELEQLKDEHHSVVCDMEESFHQQLEVKDSHSHELEKQVKALVEEKAKIEHHKLELANQLKSLMQSHCEEALRLLRLTHPSSNLMDISVSSNRPSSEPCQLSKEINLQLECNSRNQVLSNGLQQEINSCAHDSLLSADSSPESRHSGLGEHRTTSAMNTSSSDSSAAQYAQFLASVCNYQPLLADLNASVASVANSISALGQASQTVLLKSIARSEPSISTAPDTMKLQHVSFLRNPVASPIQQLQQSADAGWPVDGVHVLSSRIGDPQLQVEGGNVTANQKQGVTFDQQVEQPRTVKSLSGSTMTVLSSLENKEAEKNVNFSNNRGTSLLTHILLHDSTNTSEESIMEAMKSPPENEDVVVDRISQQENRQQQLHHYIRMLLQRSPRVSTDCEQSSGGKLSHQDNLPAAAQDVSTKRRLNGTENLDLQPTVLLNSPEQDFQLHQMHRNPLIGSSNAKQEPPRSFVAVQQDPANRSTAAELSSLSQTGDVLSQQQLLELCNVLGHHRLTGINASIQTPLASMQLPKVLLPSTELHEYLKSSYEKVSQDKMNQNEKADLPSGAAEPTNDFSTREVLPKNHPNHQVIKDIAVSVGVENVAVKQESQKHSKINKLESTKPKNAMSASRQSDRKEKSTVPRNSNKQAAWK